MSSEKQDWYDFPLVTASENESGLMQKLARVLVTEGVSGLVRRATGAKAPTAQSDPAYPAFARKAAASAEELRKQAAAYEEGLAAGKALPLVSVVVPLYRTDETCLRALVSSVQAQTYGSFQLVLSDGSGPGADGKTILTDILTELAASDQRIRVTATAGPAGICENTKSALAAASGDIIAFMDHDDLLTPDALHEVVKAFEEAPDAGFVYSDQDNIDAAGQALSGPFFKPDFSPVLLEGANYINHLLAVKAEFLQGLSAFDDAFEGAQDYDLLLRLAEKGVRGAHIPKVLYHWRLAEGSTAGGAGNKSYAFNAGKTALEAHFKRIGKAVSVEELPIRGSYRVCLPEPVNAAEEISLIRTGSKEALALNREAGQAEGRYLLFADEGLEVGGLLQAGKILLSRLRFSDAAAVGGRARRKDKTTAGGPLSYSRTGEVFELLSGQPYNLPGDYSRAILAHEAAAVSKVLFLVERGAFLQAGGFDPAFSGEALAADFCLRLAMTLGKPVLYEPAALVSCRRNLSVVRAGNEAEMAAFAVRWGQTAEKGDPFYNINFSTTVPYGLAEDL